MEDKRADIWNIPAADLEQTLDFNMRHKPGATTFDFLKNTLPVLRQIGYATPDDSWGEVEKELTIGIRNLVRAYRALDYVEATTGQSHDALLDLGESYWLAEREMKGLKEKLLKKKQKGE